MARTAPQIGRVLVNILRTGNAVDGRLIDINHADVGLAQRSSGIAMFLGVKARLSPNIVGNNDLEASISR
jgi:hypothetical protein